MSIANCGTLGGCRGQSPFHRLREELLVGQAREVLVVIEHGIHGDARAQDVNQPAHVVAVPVTQDHHLDVVYALLLEVGHDGGAGGSGAAVYEDAGPVRAVQPDAITLADVNEGSLEEIAQLAVGQRAEKQQ